MLVDYHMHFEYGSYDENYVNPFFSLNHFTLPNKVLPPKILIPQTTCYCYKYLYFVTLTSCFWLSISIIPYFSKK